MRLLFKLMTIILLAEFCVSNAKGGNVIIDISSYNPANETSSLFTQFVDNFVENVVQVTVSNNATTAGFYLLQVHSFQYDISLSEIPTNPNLEKRNITGRNVGLVQSFQNQSSTSFKIEKWTKKNSTIMVAVTIYENLAPVPGGCPSMKTNNLEQNVIPVIRIVDSSDMIAIKTDGPSVHGLSCNASKESISVEIYHMYLSSQNFDPFEYYSGIKRMLTIDDIKNNGRLVLGFQDNKNFGDYKLFSSYIGVGEVFNILVSINGKTSAYIPSISYGEDINNLIKKDQEGKSGQAIFVVLFSILPFVALVTIYKGHTFFHFTTFSLGMFCGTIISFFVLSKEGGSTVDDTFLVSLTIGFLYGLVWVSIWYKWGIPLLSATLAFVHTGALIAAMIYHAGCADNENFHKDGLYWSIFGVIIFMCWFTLSVFTMYGHIFSCSFLGTYILMVTTLNFWMGGNLQYVIINVYRRLFVPNFNKAVLDPPFQPRDKFVILCGIIFILHGYNKQVKNQRGKPPFPPHNYHRFEEERSPLLGAF